jgi:YD repeat-containing protein
LTTCLSAAGGAHHGWTVDGAGDPITGTDPAGATDSAARDGNGNVRVFTDRKGQRTEVTLGAGDRPTGVVFKWANDTVKSTLAFSRDPAPTCWSGSPTATAPMVGPAVGLAEAIATGSLLCAREATRCPPVPSSAPF